MPIRKYDAGTLGREYATARRAAGGVLTQDAFFRAKKIPVNYGTRKYGQVLNTYWARSVAAAEIEFTRRNGVNLAKELGDLFAKHKQLASRGFAAIAPEDGKGLEPDGMEEALQMFREGSHGLRDVVKILSGGLPVQAPKLVDPVFRWNEPKSSSEAKKPAKTKRR